MIYIRKYYADYFVFTLTEISNKKSILQLLYNISPLIKDYIIKIMIYNL